MGINLCRLGIDKVLSVAEILPIQSVLYTYFHDYMACRGCCHQLRLIHTRNSGSAHAHPTAAPSQALYGALAVYSSYADT